MADGIRLIGTVSAKAGLWATLWTIAGMTVAGVASASSLQTQVLRGSIGPYRVGASLVLGEHDRFVSGHYYYARHLTDIPLTGGIVHGRVTWHEPGGGVFDLRFVDRRGMVPDAAHATRLEGTWQHGATHLPVTLRLTSSFAGTRDRWYAQVTSASDHAFEAQVRAFVDNVLQGQRAQAARYVAYPLRVNTGNGQIRMIDDAEQLLAEWRNIFTPETLTRLRQAMPHDMFVHNGRAMLADGLVWFDARGACAINLA